MYTSLLGSAVPHCCAARFVLMLHHPYMCPAVPPRCAWAPKRRRAILLSSSWQPLEHAHSALEPPLRRRILLHAQPVPHQLLLPRVSLLVHPGGSGSVAAALLAGVPQLTFPLHFDQVVHVSAGWRAQPLPGRLLLHAFQFRTCVACCACAISYGPYVSPGPASERC